MARRFRIHPAIGTARVGNAPEAFFIGPEHPGVPANSDGTKFDSFRDEQGRIKRQAARFRVFEYSEDPQGQLSLLREIAVGDDVVDIEWRVHVANRKASFFTFNGPSGSEDVYVDRSRTAPTAVEKAPKVKTEAAKAKGEKDEPGRPNLRNPLVPEADRAQQLELDPGEKLISRTSAGPVTLTNPNQAVSFIRDLGELRLDDVGRLLVFGGHGVSGSTEDPAKPMDEYANNDTWFDDVSDGSVKARVRLADGSSFDADAAWVTVGPPDFAPGIGNVVSLYDTLWDLGVRELQSGPADGALADLAEQRRAWAASGGQSLTGYRPSFTRDIYPILKRALGARSVFDPGEMDRASFHVAMVDWDTLAAPHSGQDPDAGTDLRKLVFGRMRDRRSKDVDSRLMPRGWGDDYKAADEPPTPEAFFSLTQIQYALLQQWAAGQFVSDWQGEPPALPTGAVTPEGLDKAAAENCVGGPFFPGIEVSWLIRRTEIYAEPFRLKVDPKPEAESTVPALTVGALQFRPGFFTQQMALPWQADFFDCQKEERESPEDNLPRFYMWWTAQRPDDTFPPGGTAQQKWIRRLIPEGVDPDEFGGQDGGYQQMVDHWNDSLSFVVGSGDDFKEEK